MKVVLSGASGFIGTALTQHLQREGHEVVRLVRRAPRDASEIPWDPKFGRLSADALEGSDGVVNLAGAGVAEGRWTLRRRERILRSRVMGTKLIAQRLASLDRPPRAFISMSATGYYGDTGDREAREEDPAGRGFLAEVCSAWEAAADPARQAGLRVVHPRAHMVLGREGSVLARLARLYRWGLGGRLGHGRQWVSWISLHDAVRAFSFLLERPVEGPVNLCAPHPVPQRAFARTLARVLHRPAWAPAPAFAVRTALGRMGQELLLEGQRAPPRKLLAAGFVFERPTLEEALRAEFADPVEPRA